MNDDDIPAVSGNETPASGPGSERDPIHDDGPYVREVSDSTRALFAAASSKLKEQLEAEDDDAPAIGDEQPAAPAAETAAAADAPPPSAPAPEQIETAPAPAATLQLEVRERAVADREAALADREKRAEALTTLRERYLDGGAADVVLDLLKEWTGADGAELSEEAADLVAELSARALGTQLGPDLRQRLDTRRALRAVKGYKADAARRDRELAEQREREQQTAVENAARAALGEKLREADVRAQYPHLTSEDDPTAIVWDVIRTRADRDPTWRPNWVEAAALAEQHFLSRNEKLRDRINRLFTPAAPAQPAAPQQSNQGAAPRAARTLTNAAAAPAPAGAPNAPTAAPADDEPYDRDAARRRSLQRLRASLAPSGQG